jgi:membrane-associated phospholipid phosphatase
MKTLIKNNAIILSFYSLVLMILFYFLANYGKVQIHLYLNQLVGNKLIDNLFYYITYLGDGGVAPVLLLIIMFYNVRLGICCTASFLLATLISTTLKYGFYDDEIRPWSLFQWYYKVPIKYVDTSILTLFHTFPSGHATQAFAIFIGLAFYVQKNLNKLLFLSLAILTAFSRVYLSQHWLIDITVGSLIGTLTALILFYFIIYKNKLQNFNKPLVKVFKP